MNRTEELLEAALSYHERSWSVFPVNSQTKRPLTEWKSYQKGLANEAEIKQWWKTYPYAGIGLVTGKISNLIVLDVDGEEGKKYIKDKGIALTACVKTKRGEHYYFRHPGFSTQNFAKKKGLDLRGDGGYVVLPPSKHPSGMRYEWIVTPEEEEPADPPRWLLSLISEKKQQKKLPKTELSKLLEGVKIGKRHDAATKIAGHFIGKGLPSNEVITLLKLWNDKNKPPLPENELNRMVEDFASVKEKEKKEKKPERIFITGRELVEEKIPEIPAPIGKGFFAPERYTILAASDGEGKTTFCIQLALSAVTGTTFLDLFPIPRPVKVLYFCGENSRGDIKAKVEFQRTEIERILERSIIKDLQDRLVIVEPININFWLNPKDNTELHNWIEEIKPKIVIFDPLADFISSERSLSDDTLARGTVKTLTELAQKHKCFPLITTHLKKEAVDPKTGRSIVTLENVWDFVHGSRYWLNSAAAEIVMIRADLQKYLKGKKLVFKFKTVTEVKPLLIMRNKNLFYEGLPADRMSLASLTPEDIKEVLERKCNGQQVKSIFIDAIRKDFGCGVTMARDLIDTALKTKLLYLDKKDNLIKITETVEKKLFST